MASNTSEPKPPVPGSLQSMLARLRGMVQALKATEPEGEELLPTWDSVGNSTMMLEDSSAASSVDANAPAISQTPAPTASVSPAPSPPSEGTTAQTSEPDQTAEPGLSSAPQICPYCQAERTGEESYCSNCGWIFSSPTIGSPATADDGPRPRVRQRYELGEQLGERGNVTRYRGLDHGPDGSWAVPIVILRSPSSDSGEVVATAQAADAEQNEGAARPDSLPTPGETAAPLPQAEAAPLEPVWPSIAWERALLDNLEHPILPRVIDAFVEDGFEYLIEELPVGRLLWDAWDDPQATAEQRFGWLKQIAGVLYHLNLHNALLEALRPDIIILTLEGQPRLTDLSELLPLPLPANPPVRATCYTAPELILASDKADGRAALYSFGAMLYALHLGRELTELDFEMQGVPKPFLQRFPDVHPLFGRLISKTFCRDPNGRFPTEEAAAADPSGFSELIRVLEDCRHIIDRVRLEIAAWTTTGMVRSGNEDAFALLHTAEARESHLGEAALVLLADGMGGYEAGEVAAAMAIDALRSNLIKQKLFAPLAGASVFSSGQNPPSDSPNEALDVEICKALLTAALQDANQQVYSAARTGLGRQNMGCTAEVVYVDGRHVVVGHVGDSRTYHLHEGRLIQLTRDQTWVHRMMELGALTAQEAEKHPRRSELQQAIGGRPEVEPALYDSTLKPGDWVVVCSDGLSNHFSNDTLREMLQSAPSAEWAARRLVNAVNLAGATDNATVVVIRAT